MRNVLIPVLLTVSALGAAPTHAGSAAPDPLAADIVAEVEALLRNQAQSYPAELQVSVEEPRLTHQESCDQLQAFLPSGQRLRPRMTVGVRCMAPQSWTTYVQANLALLGNYYVASRAIQLGDTIGMDDLTPRDGDLLRIAPGVVFDASQVVGYIAGQRINPGSPVKASALRDPNSIQRGQAVRTEARGRGFVATGEGQALQAGSPGAQIQVKTSSGQIVTGTVLNATTVQVMM